MKCVQRVYPEKKGDPASRKFQKEWLESCDEAERAMIYQSAYKSYMTANKTIPLLLVARDAGPPVLRHRDHGGRTSGGGVDHCDALLSELLREDPERKAGLRRT